VAAAVEKKKGELSRLLAGEALVNYPRDQVREVLRFWGVNL
jgi:hypothetical protein